MDTAIVNTYAYVLLTRILLQKLKQRKTRSAVVTVASSISFCPSPFSRIYACTKVFDRFWANALTIELAGTNIDTLSVCPMYVSTQMTKNMDVSTSSGVIDAQTYVPAIM